MSLPLLVNFLLFALFLGAGAAWSVRILRPRAPMVIAHALLCLGLVFHLSWMAFWWHPGVGKIVVPTLVVIAAGSLLHLRSWRSWRDWTPLACLVASVALVHHGFAFLWGGAQHSYALTATRYLCGPPPPDGSCGPMPPDNLLPAIFAQRLWDNQDTALLLGDWNGSDRPPLQSGAILLGPAVTDLVGVDDTNPVLEAPNFLWSLAASSLAQFLVLLAVVALVGSLGFSRRSSVLTAVFVSVLPLSVFNLLFTWPKMLSAAFGVAALAVLVGAIRQRSRPLVPVVTAGALAALSALSHGGAVFALPLFAGLTLALLLTKSVPRVSLVRRWAVPCLAAAGTVVLLMAPWAAYGTWADPSNGRLLKWHLAGVSAVDHRPFLTVLREAYGSLPYQDLVDIRQANLRALVDPVLGSYFEGPAPGYLIHWRNRDFFKPLPALCFGAVLAVGFLLLTVLRLPKTRDEGPTSPWLPATLLMWLSIVSIVFWGALMFLPNGTVIHAGSYIWLVILAAVPFAFVVDRIRWGMILAVVLVLAQTAYSATVYWSMAAHAALTPIPPAPQVLDTRMLLMVVLGVLGVIACTVVVSRQAPEADPAVPIT